MREAHTDPYLGHAAEFLHLLTRDPLPADVCAEIVANPSMPAGLCAAAIALSEPPAMREVARHGRFPEPARRHLSPAGTSAARCLREGRILLLDEDGRHVPSDAPLLAMVPIRSAGRTVGVLSLAFAGSRPWSIGECRAAEAVAQALGLWSAATGLGDVPIPAPTLTGRQHESLRLLAQDCSTTEMARRLGVSRTTVKSEIRAILAALGVHDRAAAVTVAAEIGLLDASGR